MRICIDKNKLLVIENENIPQVKEYTYTVGGYMFSDFDKGIIVLNKKVWKIINLKNLSDNMSVAYIKNGERETGNVTLDMGALQQAFGLFNSFDETSGGMYFFVPGIGDKDVQTKNHMLEKLHLSCRLKKTDKCVIIDGVTFTGTEKRLSFLFGLAILYGKFDIKNGALTSFKIQLPLFGQYLKYSDVLDLMMAKLQEHALFMKTDKLQTSNGIVYQISCTDYEVLELFAKWYEPVEKFAKITKRDFIIEMKSALLEFIKSDDQIPEEGKNETIAAIEKGRLKLLTK